MSKYIAVLFFLYSQLLISLVQILSFVFVSFQRDSILGAYFYKQIFSLQAG